MSAVVVMVVEKQRMVDHCLVEDEPETDGEEEVVDLNMARCAVVETVVVVDSGRGSYVADVTKEEVVAASEAYYAKAYPGSVEACHMACDQTQVMVQRYRIVGHGEEKDEVDWEVDHVQSAAGDCAELGVDGSFQSQIHAHFCETSDSEL